MSAFDWLLLISSVFTLIFFLGTTVILLLNQLFLISKNTTKIELWHKHWATQDASAKGQVCMYV
jgi:ABC-type phosphate transport system permease subunit